MTGKLYISLGYMMLFIVLFASLMVSLRHKSIQEQVYVLDKEITAINARLVVLRSEWQYVSSAQKIQELVQTLLPDLRLTQTDQIIDPNDL